MKFQTLLVAAALALGSTALADPPQPGEAENPGGDYGLMGQPGAETLNQRAQQADPTQGTPGKQLGIDETTGEAPAQPPITAVSANQAFDLPATAARLRGAGYPEDSVEDALEAMNDAKIGAAEAAALMNEMLKLPMPQHEDVLDELGDVFEENVEEGLRGQALLTAVHADLMARAAVETNEATQFDPGRTRPITDPPAGQ